MCSHCRKHRVDDGLTVMFCSLCFAFWEEQNSSAIERTGKTKIAFQMNKSWDRDWYLKELITKAGNGNQHSAAQPTMQTETTQDTTKTNVQEQRIHWRELSNIATTQLFFRKSGFMESLTPESNAAIEPLNNFPGSGVPLDFWSSVPYMVVRGWAQRSNKHNEVHVHTNLLRFCRRSWIWLSRRTTPFDGASACD